MAEAAEMRSCGGAVEGLCRGRRMRWALLQGGEEGASLPPLLDSLISVNKGVQTDQEGTEAGIQ